ncbi:alpha/beta fold hydrolase [Usitatibacter palustris]|uniref:Haloacetate dehalogenase H-1 n=1 Tax=Usitatibacter palustris TaxID=2732487 RepID=A0A6M4HAH1_9PROT|nr:alpha/beta hydrolase [Usitatibacter palustris]QJR16135.1 Haloacetate dehalogenase H-1 [Usitatibacter palustris]
MTSPLFEGFRSFRAPGDGIDVAGVTGGAGPPLLLLHGYPQTHAIWHRIGARLAKRYTVVAPDLRGYGDSGKPRGTADHANYSKRTMGADMVAAMKHLGHERFFLAGHDRGGRVAHRLAMDHPAAVTKVAVLDIAPTLAMYEQTTEAFARAYWHWFFLILPPPVPEKAIGADAIYFLRAKFGAGAAFIAPEAMAEYERCFTPETIHGSCEDYRAAAGIDLEHDRADRTAGRKLACPLLALWGANGVVERCFKPLDEWRKVADDVRGRALAGGHYLPEERPDDVAGAFEEFFT